MGKSQAGSWGMDGKTLGCVTLEKGKPEYHFPRRGKRDELAGFKSSRGRKNLHAWWQQKFFHQRVVDDGGKGGKEMRYLH